MQRSGTNTRPIKNTSDLLDLSDRLFTGDAAIEDHHPFSLSGDLAEVAPGVLFVASFGNSTAIDAGDGLVVIDTGSPFTASTIKESIRSWSKSTVHTILYTHGHIDHVSGAAMFEKDGPLKVIGHADIARRFDRYRLTAGYNAVINRRQFQLPELRWPTEYRYPDETYTDEMALRFDGISLQLHHARGETDDHTWTWIPEKKMLVTGDLFIWSAPNAGNPQKVQRYPVEWAEALRTMEGLPADVMLPGHGLPIAGRDRVRQALGETAEFLESLAAQTLEMMNAGATLEEIVHTVKPPKHLTDRPYLKPNYDEPGFIVRNIWRLYGGWYSGEPADLKPPPRRDVAIEMAALAGGADSLRGRAEELAAAGNWPMACELIDLASLSEPNQGRTHLARADIYEQRAMNETSTMSKGIFSWAARESRIRAEDA